MAIHVRPVLGLEDEFAYVVVTAPEPRPQIGALLPLPLGVLEERHTDTGGVMCARLLMDGDEVAVSYLAGVPA